MIASTPDQRTMREVTKQSLESNLAPVHSAAATSLVGAALSRKNTLSSRLLAFGRIMTVTCGVPTPVHRCHQESTLRPTKTIPRRIAIRRRLVQWPMRRALLWLFAASLWLLTAAVGGNDDLTGYIYPITDPFEATVTGTPPDLRYKVEKERPMQVKSFDLEIFAGLDLAERTIPGVSPMPSRKQAFLPAHMQWR